MACTGWNAYSVNCIIIKTCNTVWTRSRIQNKLDKEKCKVNIVDRCLHKNHWNMRKRKLSFVERQNYKFIYFQLNLHQPGKFFGKHHLKVLDLNQRIDCIGLMKYIVGIQFHKGYRYFQLSQHKNKVGIHLYSCQLMISHIHEHIEYNWK